VRTRRNVADADATLVLDRGKLSGGTLYTARCAARLGRPCLVVTLAAPDPGTEAERVVRWIEAGSFAVLNVAGPRASRRPGIYRDARAFLDRVLAPRDPRRA
jgi:hypothetical protein